MEGLAARFTSISKIKYDYFKGTSSDVADSYVSQFESIANANNKGSDVDKLRILLGLLRKQTRIWYSQVEPGHVGTWYLLKDEFLNQFREIGYKSRILGRLNNVQKKSKESLRKYTRKVKNLIGKLTGVYPVDMQIKRFLAGLPPKIDQYCRQEDMTSLAEVIATAKNFETSKLARKRRSTKKYRKSKTDSSDSDDDSDSDSSTSSSSSESESSDSSKSETDKGERKNKRQTKRKDDTKVVEDKPKASSSNSGMWCTKCGTSGHTKEDCTTVNVKYIEDPTQEDRPKFAPKRHNPPKFSGPGKSQTSTKPVSDNCYNCGEPGHFSLDCPQPRKPPDYVPLCSNCREPGHKYPDCPQPQKPRPKYQYVATLAVADTKAKAATDAVVQRIDVIEEKLAKTEDHSWPSDVEKLFKVTTRNKSSSKPDQKSSTKHKKSSKKKSSSKTTNKSTTKEDLKDDPDYDRDVAIYLQKISWQEQRNHQR
ncbi:hypothetical protein O6H91_07G090600 [Diphasiastrum complanatum]|uniref:Uncharacterized protein n=1 Tax=Diphasiastrum complanatum TaxID=34168 RepID=A0ACC2D7P5_DIPCM|nr:hypothetical protein O6H91_07G090600 [Diphasiastrum complanatum]